MMLRRYRVTEVLDDVLDRHAAGASNVRLKAFTVVFKGAAGLGQAGRGSSKKHQNVKAPVRSGR